MKKNITISTILMLIFSISTFAQTNEIRHFYRLQRWKEETVKLTIPAFLIDMGSWFIPKEDKPMRKIMRKVGTTKILAMENLNAKQAEKVKNFNFDIQKSGYEQLIRVREGDSKVNIMIKEKDNKIRKLLILVSESDGFVMVSSKCKISIEDLNKVINKYIEDDKVKAKIQKRKEHKKPKPLEKV